MNYFHIIFETIYITLNLLEFNIEK